MPIPLQHLEPEKIPQEAEVIPFPSTQRQAMVHEDRFQARLLLRDRIFAHMIDAVIVHGFSLYFSRMLSVVLARIVVSGAKGSPEETLEMFQQAVAFGQVRLWLASAVMVSCLYVTLGHHYWGRTFGKALFGLRVLGDSGAFPDVKSSFRRWLSYLFTYAGIGLPWLTALTQGESQTIHDRIGKTRVVRG